MPFSRIDVILFRFTMRRNEKRPACVHTIRTAVHGALQEQLREVETTEGLEQGIDRRAKVL